MAHRFMRLGPDPDEKPTQPVTREMLLRIAATFTPHWRKGLFVLGAIAASAVLGVFPPLLARSIVDRAILPHDGGLLNWLVVAMVVVSIAGGLVGVGLTYLNTTIGQSIVFDLRTQLYARLRKQGMRFFTHAKAGELVSRLSSDVSGIEGVVTTTVSQVLQNVLTVGTTLAVMIALDWKLTLVSLAILPLFIVPTRRVGKIRRELAKRRQRRVATLSGIVTETLGVSGAQLIKTFGRDAYEIERFAGVSDDLRQVQIRESMVGRWFFMTIQTFWAAAPAVVWLVGGHQVIEGTLSLGDVIAFTALQARLFLPINQILTVHIEVQAALALFERIFEYLDLEPDVIERNDALDHPSPVGRIAFEAVSFSYRADLPVLQEVSFEVAPGTMTALVGPSGAGKSTIAALVSRLYDPDSGRITLDGLDLRDLTLNAVADAVGVVAQDTFLFHATLRENLLYARPGASRDEMMSAADAAQIHDFVSSLPEGYETVVGERGYRLSGGEKQRVSIARAILKDPKVLVLDEATSALDTRSERLIQQAVAGLLEGRTAIVIAHRLSTILAAEQILVVDAGRIIERGRHADLLARGGLYARLYREQFGGEPLAEVLA
ncbi:MAG TPA: ABC transporter ATP-binding protein [Actinomycetota bacterium]|nr:ABC transporter ATP-binding protein [Actinomycetota bacterium]